MSFTLQERTTIALGCISAIAVFLVGMALVRRPAEDEVEHVDLEPVVQLVPLTETVRDIPSRFPRDTHLPNVRETAASGAIGLIPFDPEVDLVHVDDDRVWWESEHDQNDTEDDHLVHHAAERPLRRLIELVSAREGTLEVHDAYRDTGIHNTRSLHKEGRAVDVTCDQMPMGELAKLCWAAGFDWVYFEWRRGNGAHIHASVRADREPVALTTPSKL